MIKPIELRLNNLLIWHMDGVNGLVVTVTEIYQSNFSVITDDRLIPNSTEIMYDVHPIPLTPEWLERFGFITLDAETDIVVWGRNDNSNGEEFSIVSDGLDTPAPLYFQYDLGYRDVKKEIQYVHQLQNLFLALTGEELILK